MKRVDISIIIPVFNGKKYISTCLDSLLNAKGSLSIEIIIIDDGSIDDTVAVIKKYIKKYKNIKLIENMHSGVSVARNSGIDNSSGKYIMFVDADDKVDENWMRDIEKNITRGHADVVTFSKSKKEYTKSEILKIMSGLVRSPMMAIGPWSKLFNNNFIREHDIKFEPGVLNGEDILFCLRAYDAAKELTFVNNSFYNYRQISGSVTKTFNPDIIKSDKIFQESLNHFIANCATLNVDTKTRIVEYNLVNAIPVLYGMISYIKKYNIAKTYINDLYKKPYITCGLEDVVYLHGKKKAIFMLYKLRLKRIIYVLLRRHRHVKYSNIDKFIKV